MTNSIIDRSPGKLLRIGLRLPIWLYRMKLGWLLGNRFLMMAHKGRKSGRLHETVVEVVRYDKDTDTYYVVSGWGEKSDWYQNIQRSPDVIVKVGRRKFQAQARFIPLEKAIEVMAAYTREHALAFRELSSLFLGDRMQPGMDAARLLAKKMPMVAFHPM